MIVDYGKPWTKNDDEMICKLHDKDKLDILEIAKIVNSSPARVAYRFIENNYSTESIRGFVEYSKTEEYINYMTELILLIKKQNKPLES